MSNLTSQLHRRNRLLSTTMFAVGLVAGLRPAGAAECTVFPGRVWEQAAPGSLAVDLTKLQAAVNYLREAAGKEGVKRMVIVRKGKLAYVPDKLYLKTLGDNRYWIKGGTDSPEDLLAYGGFDDTRTGSGFAVKQYAGHVRDWKPGDPDLEDGRGKAIIGAINCLAEQHVNLIYFLPMNIGGDGQNVWPFAGNINPAGDPANDNTHYDISKLHQWEIVFSHAQEKGIVLHFVFGKTCSHDGQVFAKTGECYAIYLPVARQTGVLNLSSATGQFAKRWYNPRTGEFEGASENLIGGQRVEIGPAPGTRDEDWIVLLKKL